MNFFVLMMILLSILSTVDAATYYVDQTHDSANDANAGTSEALPWKTLHRAVDGISTRESGGSGGPYTPVVAGDTVYVKNGTYADIVPASDITVSIKYNPVNTGTASAPIALRAYTPSSGPRHRPLVTRLLSSNPETNPVFGSWGRSYIIWDGISSGTGAYVRFNDCQGCVLENSLIERGPGSGSGNYDGVWIENSVEVIIRNNVVRNSYSIDNQSGNGSCIKLWNNQGVNIHHNDISRCQTGIYNKSGGLSNIFEYNYIFEILGTQNNPGIRIVNTYDLPSSDNVVRYNVIVSAQRGIYALDRLTRNLQIYNNTIYDVSAGVVADPAPSGSPSMRVYNNAIVRRDTTGSDQAHHVYNDWAHPDPDVPPDLLSNYSSFFGLSSAQARFAPYIGAGAIESLTQWQARGYDLTAIVADPLFVGPLTSPFPATVFKLQGGSPLVNAGRVGGVDGGAAVNIGAYPTGNETIGNGGIGSVYAPTCVGNCVIAK